MRRPLFMVCLCLVAIAAVRLWLYDSSDTSVLVDEEIITVTGRVIQKDAQSFIIQSVSLSDAADLRQDIPFDENLICEYDEESKQSTDGANYGSSLQQEGVSLRIGSIVTVRGSFRRFSEATNPGEFDIAKYYRTLGISGKLADITMIAQGEEYSVWRETLYRLRSYFKSRLYTVFPQKEASVLTAMLIGDKEELDSGIKDLYKENGIIHILSISGLHITMIGMSIYQLLRRFGVPVWLAAVCGGGILCLYGVLTGLSVSACRAIGMYLIRMLAEVVGRTYDMLTALGVMAAIMVYRNPENLYNAGFLLSFGSILGIGWFYPAILPEDKRDTPKRYEPRKWKKIIRRMWREWRKSLIQSALAGGSVTLFTLPIQLWFYYEVPLYSIILNLLVLPFMSLLMMTGLVVMILPGTGIIGTITCLILQGYEWLCECFSRLPFHTWNPGRPEIWQMVVYYVILCVIVFRRNKKCEKYCYLWTSAALTLAVITLTLHVPTQTTVTFLDVGQGDCIVIETASGEVFVFDCGSTGRKQVGEYVLLPFLKYSGIRHIDAVFVSHGDMDHSSGIEELLAFKEEEGIFVEQLVLPGIEETMRKEEMSSLLQAARAIEEVVDHEIKDAKLEPSIRISYISAGDTFSTESMSFLCLHPPQGYKSEDANAYSQCFYVEVRDKQNYSEGELGTADEATFSLLLTGDVEGEGEELLLQQLRDRGITNVTVLKVPHHGSRYSTSEEFLETVKPQLSVISCGINNSYGHPHAETLERLEDAGSVILTTPEYGAITVEVGRGIEVYLEH